MRVLLKCVALGAGFALTGLAGAAFAEPSWVQIEAKPSRSEAEARAQAWATAFPNVGSFALPSGWYAVALGPFTDTAAAEQAALLRREGMIPPDAFVADQNNYRQQIWPATAPAAAPQATAPLAPLAPPPQPQAAPDETPAQARASEARLTRDERMTLQEALQWQGVYSSGIDGAFGQGTRRSMQAWQAAIGAEETGVLTSVQRADLQARTQAERAALGLAPVRDEEAGIAVVMPGAMVKFDRYEPPFAVYGAKDGSGAQVLLISQQGDQNSLFALYEIMQSFEIVPLDGPRERGATSFSLTGRNDHIISHTEVSLKGGLIKGFTLVWPAPDAARMERVLAAMQASIAPFGDRAMDDALGEPVAVASADLVSGLVLRKPTVTRSGFYVTAKGAVLTTADAAQGCGRVTVDGAAFDVAFTDPALGVAVLTPRTALAPVAVAEFQTLTPRPESEVAVAGYPYADALSAPVLTFGRLAALNGLQGEPDQERLRLTAMPGDAGGPVLDATGAVIGVLLTAPQDAARLLPADLALARQATALAPLLSAKGFAPVAATRTGALAAEDLAQLARGMAVQVSCWN